MEIQLFILKRREIGFEWNCFLNFKKQVLLREVPLCTETSASRFYTCKQMIIIHQIATFLLNNTIESCIIITIINSQYCPILDKIPIRFFFSQVKKTIYVRITKNKKKHAKQPKNQKQRRFVTHIMYIHPCYQCILTIF